MEVDHGCAARPTPPLLGWAHRRATPDAINVDDVAAYAAAHGLHDLVQGISPGALRTERAKTAVAARHLLRCVVHLPYACRKQLPEKLAELERVCSPLRSAGRFTRTACASPAACGV